MSEVIDAKQSQSVLSDRRRALFNFPDNVDTHPFWAFVEALGLDKYLVDVPQEDECLFEPNACTEKAMRDVRAGKVYKAQSTDDLLKQILG